MDNTNEVQISIIYFVMFIGAIVLIFLGRFVNKRFGQPKEKHGLFNSDDICRRRMTDSGNPFSPFYNNSDHPG